MKPGKLQRSKQIWQEVMEGQYDRAQFFVLRSYTMNELRNRNVRLLHWLVS